MHHAPFSWRTLGKQSGLGLAASGVILTTVLFRTVLLTKGLSIGDFSIVVICLNFFAFSNLLIRPGVPELLLRYTPEFATQASAKKASLICLGFYLSCGAAATVMTLTWFLTPWISSHFYHNLEIVEPLRALGFVVSFALFQDTAGTILRMENRFTLAILPRTAGTLVSLVIIAFAYFTGTLRLSGAIFAIFAAELTAIILMGLLVFTSSIRKLPVSVDIFLLKHLYPEWKRIRKTTFETSLLGLLRSGSDIGGVFLLGILGTPNQIAMVGFIQQLTRPILMLQSNIGQTVAPTVTKLYSQANYSTILLIMERFVVIGGLVLAFGIAVAWPFLPACIQLLSGPEYMTAGFPLVLFATAQWIQIMFLPFFSVALASDDLRRRSLAVAIRFLYLGCAILIGLDAISLAIVLVAGSLTIRLFNDIPLYLVMRKLVEWPGISIPDSKLTTDKP